MLKYLDRDKAVSILKKKIIELSLTTYMYREEKIKENMNNIYWIIFGHSAQILQSALKWLTEYDKK